MYTPRDRIILDYSYLAQGDAESGQLCPKCEGGGSREHSLSVGHSGTYLWWRCHRASCNFHGSHTFGKLEPRSPKQATLNKLTYDVVNVIPRELTLILQENLHLTANQIENAGWKWTDAYGGRVVMPIYSYDGRTLAHQLRSYSGNEPKGLINRFQEGELVCWYKQAKYPSVLVVVEDQPSAVRVAGLSGFASMALIGTSLNYERAALIKKSGIKHLVLSLDQDATAKSISLAIEYRRVLPTLKIVALEKDIKNMSTSEFTLYIEEVMEVTKRG